MYCGALGKTGNCQIGVSVHAVTDWASAAVDWRLFVPKSWDEQQATDEQAAAQIRARRARSGIPDTARHREKWRLALDMLDELTAEWGRSHRAQFLLDGLDLVSGQGGDERLDRPGVAPNQPAVSTGERDEFRGQRPIHPHG
jgi:DDE superfamily endonuclease